MSGDFQIILLVVASILSAFGYEEYGIPRQVSGGVFTFLKALGIAWASLYCERDSAHARHMCAGGHAPSYLIHVPAHCPRLRAHAACGCTHQPCAPGC